MEIIVGIGESKVSKSGVLKTVGLGSCLGIAIYEMKLRAGALAHAMLPKSNGVKSAKYVDSAIEISIEALENLGGDKRNMVAKIAGGAQIFKHMTLENLMIGERNLEVAKEILKEQGIRIISEDTGGSSGRTLYFFVNDGRLLVKYSNGNELWI
ncbi:MAG: chemotaxis protein CheD [Archaeoglobaceae archaeon]|nr:chemotaxis protein CheD [Archaeoglobaceae archaeon]MDK2875922.1 chemotaxis protein CheD [Archaeoglobaceae archaeon]